MLVLAAGHRVQVDHAVDAVLGAQAHRAVEALEALLAQLERALVALEVAVVDRDPDAVDAEVGEQLRVAVPKKRVSKRRRTRRPLGPSTVPRRPASGSPSPDSR